MTIMVVEDEKLLLHAIQKKLEKSGKFVIPCSSADQAFEVLKSGEKLPDIIWLDYYLQDTNGLEFMSKLKQEPKWAGIPVVVVSNSASADKVSQMMALGVRKYLLKAESKLEDLVDVMDEVGSSPGGGGQY